MWLTNKISKFLGKETTPENFSLPPFSQEQLGNLFDGKLLPFTVGNKEIELAALPLESEPWKYWRFLLSDEMGRTIGEITLDEANYDWHGHILYDKYDKIFDTVIDQLNNQKEDVAICAKIIAENEKNKEEALKTLQGQD